MKKKQKKRRVNLTSEEAMRSRKKNNQLNLPTNLKNANRQNQLALTN